MSAPTRIPGIPYAAAPSAESSARALQWPPRIVVIHDTGNPNSTAAGEAAYAHSRPVKGATSAHAYIDQAGPLGSLRLDRQAWAAYTYANGAGIHLELCLTGDQAVTRGRAAQLTAQLCDMAGIPKVKLTPAEVAAGARGVCGHRDITIGLHVGDHTDPGADFPWPAFMAAVNGGVTDMSEWTFVNQAAADEWRLSQGAPGYAGQARDTALAFAWQAAAEARTAAQACLAQVTALTAIVQAASGSLDVAAVLAGVDERLAALAAEQRDAVADLGEGGAAQVRADA